MSYIPVNYDISTLPWIGLGGDISGSAGNLSFNPNSTSTKTFNSGVVSITNPKFPTAPTTGIILSTDANGNATWQPGNRISGFNFNVSTLPWSGTGGDIAGSQGTLTLNSTLLSKTFVSGTQTVSGNLIVSGLKIPISVVSGQILTSNALGVGTWQNQSGASVTTLPAGFTSTQQTILAASQLTIAHGLGAVPRVVNAWVIAQNSVLGYTAGDELYINLGDDNGSVASEGASVIRTTTNLIVRFGAATAVWFIVRKDDGHTNPLDSADWKIVFEAFK